MSHSNQCPACEDGKVLCHTTRVNRELGIRTRYLRCDSCGHVPCKQIIPLEIAPICEGMEQSWLERKKKGAEECPASS